MNIVERLRDFFNPQSDIPSEVQYWCYECYQIFTCKIDVKGTDWNKLTVICKHCKGKLTVIHKVNGQVIRAD